MAIFPSSMPYDDITIIDQSQYVEPTTAAEPVLSIPTGPALLCPFISPRGYGKDNTLINMSSTRLAKYGSPNLKKYGLSLYLAKRFMDAGGSVFGMRVVDDAATYANACIYVRVSHTEAPAFTTKISGTYLNTIETYRPVWISVNDESGNTVSFDEITLLDRKDANTIGKLSSDGDDYAIPVMPTGDGVTLDPELTGDDDIPTSATKFAFSKEKFDAMKCRQYSITINGTPTIVYLAKPSATGAATLYKYEEKTVDTATTVTLTPVYTAKLNVNVMLKYGSTVAPETVNPEEWFDGTGKDPVPFNTGDGKIGESIDNVDLSGITNISQIFTKQVSSTNEQGETVTTETIDSYVIPLFIVKAKARGSFANGFRFRIISDTTMNSQTNNAHYFYKFIDSDNGATLDENMSFTFNDDYSYKGKIMAPEEVFADYSENVEFVRVKQFDKFVELIDAVMDTLEAKDANPALINSKPSVDQLDILFGSNTYAVSIIVDLTSLDAINFSKSTGEALNGGSDGAFENATFDFDNDPFADALAKVYNGEVTDLIYDEYRFPYTYVFAPSYDANVVSAIHGLVTEGRHITRANYFLPKFSTYEESRAWRNANLGGVSHWKETIVPEWGQIRDPYTNKRTYMPSVYFDAYEMPFHWMNKQGKPYAGPRNYTWNGFITGSLVPCSVNPNEYIANHNVGINTVCEDGIGSASPYEQITSQGISSKLSEINNAITLVEMVRIALRIARDKRWEELTDTEITDYKTTVENAIASYLSNSYQTLEVLAERESVNGAGRDRIHCRINVKFKDMLKGISYEFYILANS